MSFHSWLSLAIALFVLGISPGPAWAAVVTTSLSKGLKSAVLMAVGIALVDVVFLLFAILGLTVIAKALGTFFLFAKYAGALYLIWLGINLWRNPPVPESTNRVKGSDMGSFVTGFTLTLGNPKAIGFYLVLLPAFLDLQLLTRWDIGIVTVTTFTIISSMLCGYAAIAARSRRLLLNKNNQKIMGRVMGTMLVGTGVAVASR